MNAAPTTRCVLVHGFGGEPFEMLPLAQALSASGRAVSVPVLPGHGVTPEAWAATGFDDWLRAVLAAYDREAALGAPVVLMGLSMGGSLCLAAACERRPAAVVSLAAPLLLHSLLPPFWSDWRLPLTPLLARLRPMWPTKPGRPESRAIAPWQGYEEVVSLHALNSLLKGLKRLRRDLPRMTAPLLAMHARGDRSVPEQNLPYLFGRAGSSQGRAVWLPIREQVTKRHLLTTHQETRQPVIDEVLRFLDDLGL